MKISFRNLKPTHKTKQVLTRFLCTLTTSTKADIVCVKITSPKALSFEQDPVMVIFAPNELMSDSEFQGLISNFPEPPFICSLETWEDGLACILPAVLNYLHLKRSNEGQQAQIARLSKETDQLTHQFQNDLELAAKIHQHLLPASGVEIPGISVTSKYLPASGLGGDYFDVFEFNEKRHLGVLIADSQTHGMASALLSSLLKVRLDELKVTDSVSQNLMNHLNREIYSIHRSKLPGLDLVFGVLDRSTLTLEYSSAGSLRPLHWNFPYFTELPCSDNPPLGIVPDHHFTTSSIRLRPGDLLFFHTNGLEAIFGKKGAPFRKDLSSVFSSIKKMEPLDFQTELLARINEYKETEHDIPDDITLIQLLIDKRALYVTQSK